MKRFAWILLLMSTSPVYAQDEGRVGRNTIGDNKPLSQTVKDDEEQPAAFATPPAKPAVEEEAKPEAPGLPNSSPLAEPQSDRH